MTKPPRDHRVRVIISLEQASEILQNLRTADTVNLRDAVPNFERAVTRGRERLIVDNSGRFAK